MLTIALKQNSLMRSKLQKISAEADISDLQMVMSFQEIKKYHSLFFKFLIRLQW